MKRSASVICTNLDRETRGKRVTLTLVRTKNNAEADKDRPTHCRGEEIAIIINAPAKCVLK